MSSSGGIGSEPFSAPGGNMSQSYPDRDDRGKFSRCHRYDDADWQEKVTPLHRKVLLNEYREPGTLEDLFVVSAGQHHLECLLQDHRRKVSRNQERQAKPRPHRRLKRGTAIGGTTIVKDCVSIPARRVFLYGYPDLHVLTTEEP